MKQIKFLILAVAFIPFMISCSDDDKDELDAPTISFDNSTITISNGKLTTPITGAVTAPNGGIIQSATASVIYSVGQESRTELIADLNDFSEVAGSNKGKYTFYFDSNSPGIKENEQSLTGIIISASVRNGKTKEENLPIQTVQYEELSQPVTFEWEKEGEDVFGTGLDSFGLNWLTNSTTNAIITPSENTKLVRLDSSVLGISTKGELKEAIENATALSEYEGISILQDNETYNEVLGVALANTQYYLIHITQSNVVTIDGNQSITIGGTYRY